MYIVCEGFGLKIEDDKENLKFFKSKLTETINPNHYIKVSGVVFKQTDVDYVNILCSIAENTLFGGSEIVVTNITEEERLKLWHRSPSLDYKERKRLKDHPRINQLLSAEYFTIRGWFFYKDSKADMLLLMYVLRNKNARRVFNYNEEIFEKEYKDKVTLLNSY